MTRTKLILQVNSCISKNIFYLFQSHYIKQWSCHRYMLQDGSLLLNSEKGNYAVKTLRCNFPASQAFFLLRPLLLTLQGGMYLTKLKKPKALRKLKCLGNEAWVENKDFRIKILNGKKLKLKIHWKTLFWVSASYQSRAINFYI